MNTRRGRRIGGLLAVCLAAGMSYLAGGEAPAPTPIPNEPATTQNPPGGLGAPPGADAELTADALAALAKTVRFLDAFPGSPAQRDRLLMGYAAAQRQQAAEFAGGTTVWAPDAIGEWMHGPVPTRITPTMAMLAWQKVLSEHYSDSLLTFAPRLRAWCLRILERAAQRMAAIEKTADGGDAQAKLERSRLVVLAQSIRRVALLLPGPADRAAGLPEWVRQLPADNPATLLDPQHADAGVFAGITPWFSENLAAEQVFQALTTLQIELALRGEQRMTWGSLTIGLLLADREDFRLLQDLNRWIEEYSPTAAAGNDFLSLAAMTQAPREPAAVQIWQQELAGARKKRLAALQAAGCVLPPVMAADADNPQPAPFAEDWRLLAWRCGPYDQLEVDYWEPANTVASAEQRAGRLALAHWEALFDDMPEVGAQPPTIHTAMYYAVRAVTALRGEPAAAQWVAWCLLTPVNFVRGPENPAPLRDDEALGPVWVDGGSEFYRQLAQAAAAHATYLKSIGIEAPNALRMAQIGEALADWAAADPAKTVGAPATAVALRDLLQARQWLAQWLQIDLTLLPYARETTVVLRRGQAQGAATDIGQMQQLFLRWTLNYAVRPESRSGFEAEAPATGPVLTMGLALQLTPRAGDSSDWTPEALQTAVLGPERKGPIRYLPALSPGSPDFETSELARRKLRVWLARDPEGFKTALEAGPYHRDGDFERLLAAALACNADRPELLDLILKNYPDEATVIYRALDDCPNQSATQALAKLAREPGQAAAAGFMAQSFHVLEDQEAYLAWLREQPEPEAALAALTARPHRAWAPIWLDWYKDDLPVTQRALLLGLMAPGLNVQCESFHRRVERAWQLADFQRLYFAAGPAIRDEADPKDMTAVLRLLKAQVDKPELQSVALAGLAISDRRNAYETWAAFLQSAAQAGFQLDPVHVLLMGTSRVAGSQPEMGRELLRAWVRRPVVDGDGKARAGSLEENQTWALAVDVLEREYILTDEDLPALVDRYVREIGADVVAPRLRLPTHGGFEAAFRIDPEQTLDRVAAALGSDDAFLRDAALAVLTTQTRVDALMGSAPVDLPVLENLALRLEGVDEATRKTQAAAWQAWLARRRGAVLAQIRAHLE